MSLSSPCHRVRKCFAHGGAWKVAYADFVTGMMSLFLVLWILSQDEEVIIATTRFFRDPYKIPTPQDQKLTLRGSVTTLSTEVKVPKSPINLVWVRSVSEFTPLRVIGVCSLSPK